jgi:hypothetical protein
MMRNVTDETFDRDFWERRWAQARAGGTGVDAVLRAVYQLSTATSRAR